ncbi:MAG: type I glyceraldehyde-3-phosphate dehydrogenase [Proteobacteria bacterium]|nr:type I glyceraldehyde-3-phosphate dehydrogenase [Pseudomonadota bacterium]
MTVRVAINGFGRIGRNVLRAIHEQGRKDLRVVAVNDLGDVAMNAYLFKRDSVHGRFPGTIETKGNSMIVNGQEISVTAERDPAKLPWRENGIDIAMECTGFFASGPKSRAHIDAGAKKVLISAPAKDVDLTVVYGVNHDQLKAEHIIVSNASCTTNCLAPLVKVLHENFGIVRGLMTTIHAYTNDQSVTDMMHKDLRRARAAALNIIPTTTGAARAVGQVLPELDGKLDGTAIRVPTANVSMIDFHFRTSRPTSEEEIHKAITKAAEGKPKGILVTNDEPLVSVDFNHNPASSIFDLTQTKVVRGRLCRVLAWYDNEWGFSNRMADTAAAMGKLG